MSQTYKITTGTLNLTNAREIASGGEGRIVEHPLDAKFVCKLYFKPRPREFEKHLKHLANLGSAFVKPVDIIYLGDRVAGFVMRYVDLNQYWLFNNLFNKGFCTANSIGKYVKESILKKLRFCLEDLHRAGIVVGDLNQYNIFFDKDGDLLFIDVDSYSTPDNPPSGVLLDDIRDWTTTDISDKTDNWAFNILTFWALCLAHPFRWVLPGNTESLEQRVRRNRSFLSVIGIKVPPVYAPPSGELLRQFMDIFGGRRYMVSLSEATLPTSVVVKQPISTTQVNVRELCTGVTGVNACMNYIAIRRSKTWTLIQTIVSKITKEIKTITCDEMFPANNGEWAYVIGDRLTGSGHEYVFDRPTYYYNAGSLQVLQYGADEQWNFNIENQIGGIDCTKTAVFTKSIIVRDAPIQNFGAKKYLNIPIRNSSILIDVPPDTMNAYYNGGWIAVEYKERCKMRWMVARDNVSIELDYLPYFTTRQDLVLIPDDGHIGVYKAGTLLSTLDAPCTRDSRLYSTTSGIILYENGTIYLLNTK